MDVKFLNSMECVGEKAWDALAGRAPTRTIFQTYAWQCAWWRADARPGSALCLAVIDDGPGPCVIFPLVQEGRRMTLVGDGEGVHLDIRYVAS